MQGMPAIIDALNELLSGELTAMDVYFVQSRIFSNWGYSKLYDRFSDEMSDESRHAELLIKRILFLEGTPDLSSRSAFTIGQATEEMLEMDLQLELGVAKHLNKVIALCESHGDNGTRKILEELLEDTEKDHIFWLESQLHQIKEIGIENYLQNQI